MNDASGRGTMACFMPDDPPVHNDKLLINTDGALIRRLLLPVPAPRTPLHGRRRRRSIDARSARSELSVSETGRPRYYAFVAA